MFFSSTLSAIRVVSSSYLRLLIVLLADLIPAYASSSLALIYMIYSSYLTLESLLDCKEIQPVHPKGDQSWVFIGRTDAKAETPILLSPDVKSWLIWKDPHAGKDWGQEEQGTTEDEMVGWHHSLNGHEFGWWTGRPGMLQSMGSQRVGHDWVTELNWRIKLSVRDIWWDIYTL